MTHYMPSSHAMRALGTALKVRRIFLRVVPLALAIGLTLATTQAQAYGGYSGHRHYGGHSYGGHYYGGHRYGRYLYRGYGGRLYGGHFGRSYGYYRPYASGGDSGGDHGNLRQHRASRSRRGR